MCYAILTPYRGGMQLDIMRYLDSVILLREKWSCRQENIGIETKTLISSF